MKKVSILSLIALVAIVISSCGSTNNSVFSKRKYTKGIFVNKKGNYKTADAKVKEVDLKEDNAIAKAEKAEAKEAKKLEQFNAFETNGSTSDMILTPEDIVVRIEEDEQTSTEILTLTDDDMKGVDKTVSEMAEFETEESVQQKTRSYDAQKNKTKSSGGAAAVDGMTVLLVILALFIPPLAVFLFEGATSRFWIDLLLAILGIGLGIGLGGLAYLAALAAVIYAVLIVLSVI